MLAASLRVFCHGGAKQAPLQNWYPNRGAQRGQGREEWNGEGLLRKKTAPVFPSKSVLLRSLARWKSEETAVAAALSSVPADREEAFVRSTVNSIGWHGLECVFCCCCCF